MCTEVYVLNGENWTRCGMVGELKAAVGEVVFDGVYEDPEDIGDDNCLCCIDSEATAKKNGFTYTMDRDGEVGFPGDALFRKATKCPE